MCRAPKPPPVKDPPPPPPPPTETTDTIDQPAVNDRNGVEQKRKGRAALRISRTTSGTNTSGTAAGAAV